jgi:hypothetical protein
MSNYNEGTIFLFDVSFNICTLLCGYYEITKHYNPKP